MPHPDPAAAGEAAITLFHNTPATTFAMLHERANRMIAERGFENLDFAGNLGHSIASHRDERIYLEAGNTRRVGDAAFFTFEPHIRAMGSPWGFKHENIYFFDPDQRLQEL